MKSTIERLYWHSKIRRWKGKEVKEKEFKSCFFQWRIPKNIRHLIMKGMEKDGLIRIEKKMVYLNDVYLKENNNKEDKDKSVYVPYSNLFPQVSE